MKGIGIAVVGGTVIFVSGVFVVSAAQADKKDKKSDAAATTESALPQQYQWIFGESAPLFQKQNDGAEQDVQETTGDSEEEPAEKANAGEGASGNLWAAAKVGKAQDIPSPEKLGNVSKPVVWNLGTVKAHDVLRYEFDFTNEDNRTLNILSVNTSCGCTVSEVKKKTLAPRESTPIYIEFKPKGYSGDVRQYIFIHTDDPANPVLKFTIRAQVVAE